MKVLPEQPVDLRENWSSQNMKKLDDFLVLRIEKQAKQALTACR
jgi:hypothetical protein